MSEFLSLKSLKGLRVALITTALGCSGSPTSPACDSSVVAGAPGSGPCSTAGGESSGGAIATGGTSGLGGTSAATGATSALGGTSAMPELSFDCTVDEDCCIVTDSCMATAYLVKKSQQADMTSYIASKAQTMCLACVMPAVQVSCQNGMCAGEKVGYAAQSGLAAFGAAHCGKLPLPATGGATSVSAVAAIVALAGASSGTGGASSTAPAKTTFTCSN